VQAWGRIGHVELLITVSQCRRHHFGVEIVVNQSDAAPPSDIVETAEALLEKRYLGLDLLDGDAAATGGVIPVVTAANGCTV